MLECSALSQVIPAGLEWARRALALSNMMGAAQAASDLPRPNRTLNGVILIGWLGLAGVAISAYVWYKHVTDGPVLCLGSGCATVIRSEYGRLMGIPNGALGVLYFGLVALTPWLERWLLPDVRSLMLIPTSIALILYLYLTYLQFFVLQAVCNWCLMSAALTLIIFGALIFG